MINFGPCGLKAINYYEDRCPYCSGERSNPCYVTIKELKEHLQDFHDIFMAKLERGTEETERQLEGILV